MKSIIILFLAVVNFSLAKNILQDTTEVNNVLENDIKSANEILTFADEMPTFPGDMEELYAFIANNIEYPEAAKRLNISGKVKVEFIVDKDGTVKNPVVVNGIGGGCDEEALRIV
ncbi:MAG TPA: energy transducer TonB, partial [Ignavibacteriales bacterium]|nr:energy transducer TonB [Ignavibacteriales bacterium]